MMTKTGRRSDGATLQDVAQAAGVSVMTVSRVVSGSAPVSDEKRARVMVAVDSLGYQVNLAARTARMGKVKVGLVYSNPSPAYLSAFLVGAMKQCSQCGVQLLLVQVDEASNQRQAIAKLTSHGIDGMLVPPPLCDSTAVLKQFYQLGLPTVAVATGRPVPEVSAVRIDDYAGALNMTRHLLALGHTDIAFIKGDPGHTPAHLRYQGFCDGMAEAGHKVAPERVAQGMFTYRSGLDAARQLLGRASRPSAIFASNDDMAAAVIAIAHGMHLQVPQDLSVCGFDDTPVATAVWPALTTIHQPIADMARSAVELLLDQVRRQRDGAAPIVHHNVMPYTLMQGESCAPPCAFGKSGS